MSQTANLCSIVIPVHDRETQIEATVRSCLVQDHQRVEVILIDDGSSDGSAAVCARLATEPHPEGKSVRFARQDNAGACVARNRGMEMATGAFLMFLDSDDLIPPGKLSTQIGAMLRDDTDCCIADYLCVDAEGRPLRRVSNAYAPKGFITGFRSPSNSAIVFRRAALPDALRWNESLDRMQDLDFMLRALACMRRWSYVPEPLYHYRMHEGARISDSYDQGAPYLELFGSMARHLRRHPPVWSSRFVLLGFYGQRLLRSWLKLGVRRVLSHAPVSGT